jgi:sigma-B regulation protein RsbU (phosphoserine phosphatase)
LILRAFIVDDEPPARVRLRQLLTQTGDVVVVGEAGDAIEARAAVVAARPDVLFLDIEMPQESGTSFARSLGEPRPFVVFATAFDHYAIDAFTLDATDYLVKPITQARLSRTLARVRERISRQSDLERDLIAASATQALLLPQALPAIPGYESSAVTVPARGVGGDFFLGQMITLDRVVLALGDVSGKGMPAGLVASSLQARLETVALHSRESPAELVADVNRTLCGRSDAARFATLAYLELDGRHNQLRLVNAGHLPVLAVAADGTITSLASTGPALGILTDARFPVQTLALANVVALVAYSDGVTEAFDEAGAEFGDTRLLQVVKRCTQETADAMCQAVLDAVRQHTRGARATDDITLLVVKRITGTAGAS